MATLTSRVSRCYCCASRSPGRFNIGPCKRQPGFSFSQTQAACEGKLATGTDAACSPGKLLQLPVDVPVTPQPSLTNKGSCHDCGGGRKGSAVRAWSRQAIYSKAAPSLYQPDSILTHYVLDLILDWSSVRPQVAEEEVPSAVTPPPQPLSSLECAVARAAAVAVRFPKYGVWVLGFRRSNAQQG